MSVVVTKLNNHHQTKGLSKTGLELQRNLISAGVLLMHLTNINP